MAFFSLFSGKRGLIIVHDLIMTVVALQLALLFRFDGDMYDERVALLPQVLPIILVVAFLIYWLSDLYRSKWRFASLPDLRNIVQAATILAALLFLLDRFMLPRTTGDLPLLGIRTTLLYALLQAALLGGPRLAYRYLKYVQSRQSAEREATRFALVIGRAKDAEVVLRAVESGTIKHVRVAGILSPHDSDRQQIIRSSPVLGKPEDLERVIADQAEREQPIQRLIVTPSVLGDEGAPDDWLTKAQQMGLVVVRFEGANPGAGSAVLAPIDIEDLLLRSSVEIDHARLQAFFAGKSVLVTGGGGSIGSEICRRALAFGASRLHIIEHAETALFNIMEELSANPQVATIVPEIGDVRDRARMRQLVRQAEPDIVVHAAALKHVHLVEQFWAEGVKTNVFGSANVIDAAVEAGVATVIVISTDKAIAPVSMLGATKRFSEIYAQARDGEEARREGGGTRLIAVRFGNVLGSVGSVVPRFKAQIARGGPVTVTHPDMIRYFMTIREACDLVLTAAAHARPNRAGDGNGNNQGPGPREAVYVLQMGQPVAIMALAERMIRLAGLKPGRDIEIKITGVRPGERLHELLFADNEPETETGVKGVRAAATAPVSFAQAQSWVQTLESAVAGNDRRLAEQVLTDAIPDFRKGALKS